MTLLNTDCQWTLDPACWRLNAGQYIGRWTFRERWKGGWELQSLLDAAEHAVEDAGKYKGRWTLRGRCKGR